MNTKTHISCQLEVWPIAREGVVYHTQYGVVTPREGYDGQHPYEGQLSHTQAVWRTAHVRCVDWMW